MLAQVEHTVHLCVGGGDAVSAAMKGFHLAKMVRWYSPREVLKMAIADNAELLALSGARSPYPGKLGASKEERSPISLWATAILSRRLG
jgi:hypothetical protein